ncbi:TraR/DksA family transcriptional regulator [Glycomyces tritici]|uniref:TraR/DksA family transcriptional regulator n=1 Tax=Glycomyces tritici TaxID=2665176 RepID=A0ABT7YIN7_9ACTN|nr:TraR/DksA family transcriptional regulator [Glycomyces tritici]MDN3238496.1 TraR/DksA family transcriptional regulator [Glycomyces tritici]
MTPAKKTQKQAVKKAVKKAAAKKAVVKKAVAKAPTASVAKKAAAKKAAKQAPPAPAVEAGAGEEETEAQQLRSESEQAELRAALKERLDELVEEQQRYTDSITLAQRERLSDTAGDDQIDSGSKTVEHEHEVAVAGSLSERIRQVSHALERLDEGGYGFCEKCGNPIPAARLAAFPSATLCVSCKQLEERR